MNQEEVGLHLAQALSGHFVVDFQKKCTMLVALIAEQWRMIPYTPFFYYERWRQCKNLIDD